MSLKDVIWWLNYDIELNQYWLNSGSTLDGSAEVNLTWIKDFQETIKWLQNQPSTMTLPDVITAIKAAQDTHRYWLTQPENKVMGDYQWQRDWIEVYDNVLEYLGRL